jgi:ectoine hydroxylase-related dioxygenase (phytanoyl-CoA dioxygenase family)
VLLIKKKKMNGLSAKEIKDFYEKNGYLGPLKIAEVEDAVEVAKSIAEAGIVDSPNYPDRENCHLTHSGYSKLCSSKILGETLACLVGDDVMVWRTKLFVQGKKGVPFSWHQGAFKDTVKDQPFIAVHIALTNSYENNCCAVLPATQSLSEKELEQNHGIHTKIDTGGGNYFYSGKEDFPGVRMILKPGECFIFNSQLIHRSWMKLETIEETRLAIAMRAGPVSTKVFQDAPCMLIYGNDTAKVNTFANPPK